jgi:HK97 family phage prohead protease
MEHKTQFCTEVKINEDGPGWLEGYGSTFGNTDRDNDVIAKGAFAASIPDFIRHGFMPVGHNWTGLSVATIEDAHEDDHGLFLRAQFHSTPEAQNARTVTRERMERGKSVGLSIGFRVTPGASERRDDGVRIIKGADLYEVSIVTVPANALATTLAIKSGLPLADQSEQVLAACQEMVKRLGSLAELRRKEGRVLSATNRDRLAQHLELHRQMADELQGMLAATAPQKALDDGAARRWSLLVASSMETFGLTAD